MKIQLVSDLHLEFPEEHILEFLPRNNHANHLPS